MSKQIETRCIHGNVDFSLRDEHRAISYPIYQTASFSHIKTGHNDSGFDYRGNPTPPASGWRKSFLLWKAQTGLLPFPPVWRLSAPALSCFRPVIISFAPRIYTAA